MESDLIDGAISAEQKLPQEYFNERLPILLKKSKSKSFVFRRSPGDSA